LVELLLESVAPFHARYRRLDRGVPRGRGDGRHARKNDYYAGHETSHRFLGPGSRRQFFRCQSAASLF
jgi:hypothetical protein